MSNKYTCWDCKQCKTETSLRDGGEFYIWCCKHYKKDFDKEGIKPCKDFKLEEN